MKPTDFTLRLFFTSLYISFLFSISIPTSVTLIGINFSRGFLEGESVISYKIYDFFSLILGDFSILTTIRKLHHTRGLLRNF